MRARVFIGSSSEGREIADNLQVALQDQFAVEIWYQDLFALGRSTIEELDRLSRRTDYAILVLTPDDLSTSRGESARVPRDNIIFEIGLFVGRLGRDRTFLVVAKEADMRLPSDLLGVTLATFSKADDITLLAAINPAVVRIRRAILEFEKRPRVSRQRDGDLPRTFPSSEDAEFYGVMETLLQKAEHVVLIGTGLNIIHKDPLRRALIERAAAGRCELEIVLADPERPEVQMRLIEEELGHMRPSVGRQGLQQRLTSLVEEFRKHLNPKTMKLSVFGHYPTFALLIVDSDYFVYPYAYARLGNFSPVIHFSRHDPDDAAVIAFLDQHHRTVSAAAVDAGVIHDLRMSGPAHIPAASLFPFAVYYVPPADSALSAFGARVLGYDIHSETDVPGFGDQVGAARAYGFHLTCSDVLYFLSEEDVRLAIEEVCFLARQFSPFVINGLQVRGHFPDPMSISLDARDPTGSLEALHSELVHRLYRRAAATPYTLHPVRPTRTRRFERAELMIRRYKAPYVLKQFHPHFTLLTNVREPEHDETVRALQERYRREVMEPWIHVDSLAIMTKRPVGGLWSIHQEIKLG